MVKFLRRQPPRSKHHIQVVNYQCVTQRFVIIETRSCCRVNLGIRLNRQKMPSWQEKVFNFDASVADTIEWNNNGNAHVLIRYCSMSARAILKIPFAQAFQKGLRRRFFEEEIRQKTNVFLITALIEWVKRIRADE